MGRAAGASGWRRIAAALLTPALLLHAPVADAARSFTLVTWNLEWLITPDTDRALRARCQRTQPDSQTRALPCSPGRKPPPARVPADVDALARTADRLRDDHQVDVIAVQEVDGPEAARQVFRKGWEAACFTRRAHPQNVGFVIRSGTPYRCHEPLNDLDVDGRSRPGSDITLWPGQPHEVRLLAVHLKSGCFDGPLDRRFEPCADLRAQIPVLEQWVDARVREGAAFAVLGDFNRHLDRDARQPAGLDGSAPLALMAALSDRSPPGAELWRATESSPYVRCQPDDTHSRYIDDVLISVKLARRATSVRFKRVAYTVAELGHQLSDHCPLGVVLEGVIP